MNTLSVAEILASDGAKGIQEILYLGGWPEIHAHKVQNSKKILDDYLNSYVEKDFVLAADMQKSREFFNSKLPTLIQCHQEGSQILVGQVSLALLKNYLRQSK